MNDPDNTMRFTEEAVVALIRTAQSEGFRKAVNALKGQDAPQWNDGMKCTHIHVCADWADWLMAHEREILK